MMNIVDLIELKYPGQIALGNVYFRKPEDRILIQIWNVPGVDKPSEDDLEAELASYENQFNISQLKKLAQSILATKIDEMAQSKDYANAVACASYSASTNPKWAAESQAFIAWRDSCYQYAFDLLSNVELGGSIPSEEDFIAGIPQLTWPE